MKTLTNRLVIFAASAVLLGTMAYGQERMKAEIPFAFHTANASLPAGNYEFDRPSIQDVVTTIRRLNGDSHKAVLALSLPLDTYNKATKAPSAEFVCENGNCVLRAVTTSAGTYRYPVPHKSRRDKEALSVLRIDLAAVNNR
jgi:hypothetical protein